MPTVRVRRWWRANRYALRRRCSPPRSTVYAVLARTGYSRLRDADRLSGVPVRYVRDHPGALVHQNQKLGRIPDEGGHRLLGRTAGSRGRGQLGYDHFEVVVDDATRLPRAERFIKTLLAEWAYGRLYRTNAERLDALPGWTAYYNAGRTHTAHGGITP